jgi:hypothetical protein
MRVIIQEQAERHLDEGYLWYEMQDPGAGDYFLQHMTVKIDSRHCFAGIHRKVRGRHCLLTSIFPFAIYYTISGGDVFVRGIFDTRRSPTWTKRQLGD